MSTFSTFLLLVTASIGTLMLVNDPTQKVIKWAGGKKKSELGAQVKSWDVEQDVSGKGCSFVFLILLPPLYKFVVEPLAVLSALVNKIGSQPVAYVMLAIVVLYWLQFARTFIHKKSSQPKGMVIRTDEEIKLPNPAWILVRRAFFSLPTLYLWYQFLVVIGVL